MKQNLTQPEEIDQILMAMSIHDLKKLVAAVGGVLEIHLQKAQKNIIRASEAPCIADSVADMQHASRDVLLCIDEILATLDTASSGIEPLRVIMQHVNESCLIVSKQISHVAANVEYAKKLPDTQKIFEVCGAL
ncbi:MAG: hypothetical protein A2Z94_06040 [Gallionellales bacterium GWA2_55_18]|nr:MAG: hypothetical protein A2Z94_06040 [Gallionellales bacterium GWA2_55_18]